MSARLPVMPFMSPRYDGCDDGHRLEPRYESLGDASVPCRWWHPDIGGYCARCGSARIDLHAGEWVRLTGLTFGKRVAPEDCEVVATASHGDFGGLPWSDAQRVELGLPVSEEWWHEAAGWPVNGGSTPNP